jgi:hypothetical protein
MPPTQPACSAGSRKPAEPAITENDGPADPMIRAIFVI